MSEQPCGSKDVGPCPPQQVVERTRGYTSRQGVKVQGGAPSIYVHETNSKDGKRDVNAIIQSVVNRRW